MELCDIYIYIYLFIYISNLTICVLIMRFMKKNHYKFILPPSQNKTLFLSKKEKRKKKKDLVHLIYDNTLLLNYDTLGCLDD